MGNQIWIDVQRLEGTYEKFLTVKELSVCILTMRVIIIKFLYYFDATIDI